MSKYMYMMQIVAHDISISLLVVQGQPPFPFTLAYAPYSTAYKKTNIMEYMRTTPAHLRLDEKYCNFYRTVMQYPVFDSEVLVERFQSLCL